MSELCREGENTLRCRKIPIVFVPGVMGSRLYFPGPDEYWDPDSTWRMSHWLSASAQQERNELHFSQTAQVMTSGHSLGPNERFRGWEGVSWEYYGPFLQWLNTQAFAPNQCPVYAVGYDWRQSNRQSADYLKARIDAILSTEQADHLILVTHSMGGIVTRAALKAYGDLAAKVVGVIHVVQPASGAVVFYRRLYTGAHSDLDGGWGFSRILGTTPSEFATVVSGLPGPSQLMPTHLHSEWGLPWLGAMRGGSLVPYPGTVYDSYTSSSLPPGLIDPAYSANVRTDLGYRFSELRTFHNWLADYKHDKTWAVFSSGVATDTQTYFQPTGSYRGCVAVRTPDGGDGTVPSASGGRLFPTQRLAPADPLNDTNRQFEVTGVEHSGAFNSGTVRDLVLRFVRHVL